MDKKLMCIDAIGSNTPKDLIPMVEKYHKKLDELADEFVNDCVKENVEYCSAFGFLTFRLNTLLSLKYSKKTMKWEE